MGFAWGGLLKRKVYLLGFCLDFGRGVGWYILDFAWIDLVACCIAAFFCALPPLMTANIDCAVVAGARLIWRFFGCLRGCVAAACACRVDRWSNAG